MKKMSFLFFIVLIAIFQMNCAAEHTAPNPNDDKVEPELSQPEGNGDDSTQTAQNGQEEDEDYAYGPGGSDDTGDWNLPSGVEETTIEDDNSMDEDEVDPATLPSIRMVVVDKNEKLIPAKIKIGKMKKAPGRTVSIKQFQTLHGWDAQKGAIKARLHADKYRVIVESKGYHGARFDIEVLPEDEGALYVVPMTKPSGLGRFTDFIGRLRSIHVEKQ